ncbi:hypothetical protein [Zavarzinella formosa]|uniref:hypothetical protein n=1 Tax=Zavarzinella formosa TaxID=360055 RepID=UPI00035F3048|nr:hypothetical protein [Zavarzinella formosa]
MLFASRQEGRISNVAILVLLGIIALLLYAPVAIIREVRRPPDEELPEWMGSARGRKIRMAFALLFVGLLAAGMWVAVVLV